MRGGISADGDRKTVDLLMPEVVEQALAVLPIQKRMRWGSNIVGIFRPVFFSSDVIWQRCHKDGYFWM